MSPTPAPLDKHLRVSDADRERVADFLAGTLSDGRLTVGELDERVAAAYAARTLGDLTPLVADLSVDLRDVLSPPLQGSTVGVPTLSDISKRVELDGRIGGRAGSHISLAVLGSVERIGEWVLPILHTCLCYLGRVTIDLREARFAKRRSTIVALSVLGDVRVVVPPDVTVRVSGVGLIGNFSGRAQQGLPGAPIVHVTGLALWGEVAVVRGQQEAPAVVESGSDHGRRKPVEGGHAEQELAGGEQEPPTTDH
jgi:hypothetical protein